MASGKGKTYTLREIAARFGGELAGNPAVRIARVATLEGATAGSIAFLANERYLQQLDTTHASAIIIGEALRDASGLPRIVCENPYAYFARVSALLNPARPAKAGVHRTAVVSGTARLGRGVEVGPLAVIERNVRVGAGSIIGAGCFLGAGVVVGAGARFHPHVTIYHDCVLGDRVVLHSGVVIGADGFGLAMAGGRWIRVPQIGRVVIGDDVDIGANTTIDRGAIDDTVIEEGVMLDNQIQVAHNVHIGAHTAIAACSGIAGSARVGRYCRIGGNSGIIGHVTIADHVEVSAHTLISKSITQPGTYTGAYAFGTHAAWRRNAAHLRHLDEFAERLRALEKKLNQSERSKL